MLLEVARHQSLDGRSVVGLEVAAADEVVGQVESLVARPRLERGNKLDLVDQAVLQGEHAEEQISIGDYGCHRVGLPQGRHGR